MSNFAFIENSMPTIYHECARAESYVSTDPIAACFYGRRAAEAIVHYLYDVLDVSQPYRPGLAAYIAGAEFKAEVGNDIAAKLDVIRKLGNAGAHHGRPPSSADALALLKELFHVVVFTAYHHSTDPKRVPLGTKFDIARAPQQAPLTQDELIQLAQRFQEQEEEHARRVAEHEDVRAAAEAEIATLRARIAEAQQANAAPDNHDYSEADTRELIIDLLLGEAGWTLDHPNDREYPVTGMPNNTGDGFVDYVLWGADGLPLAVVEAKRTTRSPQIGKQQAKLYADCLQAQFGRRPIIFYTNGYEHWIWDDAAFGESGYPDRPLQGFYTRAELELTIERRGTRQSLTDAPIDSNIVERYYQTRAIKAIGATLERRQREALLVMATGAGKTRTAVALVDQLMKAGWVKRVLFLADRKALVRQAAKAFTAHLPHESTVNLVTDRSAEGRVYVSTYPTILNLINTVNDNQRRFGPGYFDLVIIDEAHRSVYRRYGAIFEWFDSYLVGLTATPKDEVDHNTYRLFHLENGVPTDAYTLDEAVRDDYLVPPKGIAVGTRFLRRGIRYDELSDAEKEEWDSLDWGDDGPPSAVDSEELNRFLFNEDTVDKVIATFMSDGYKVAGGDRLGKTIIFAKNQAHAEFIERRFNLAYPEYGGEFARVITHATTYADSLIEKFSSTDEAPHIAISVDMLDTGIDVPEVVNLVFFKAVHSKSKFWQMIGRGTRLRPDLFGPGEDKKDFLVFDFCGNLEYFSHDLPSSDGIIQKSLTQQLFEQRLGLVRALDTAHIENELRSDTAAWMHTVVSGMNLDNVIVRAHRRQVETWSDRSRWQNISIEDATEIVQHLAGLPSSASDSDETAKRFDLLVLRRQLAQLESDAVTAERMRVAIQSIASALLPKYTIPMVAAQLELLEQITGDEWWIDVTLPMLELVRQRVRSLVGFIERTTRNPIYTDFEDTLEGSTAVTLPQVTAGLNWERFQEKARAYLRDHKDHVALQRLRRNKQLTSDDLDALATMLIKAGGDQDVDLEWVTQRAGDLGPFIRSLVGLDRAAVNDAFSIFLDKNKFSVEQIRFISLVIDELTSNGTMDPARLFESPYTDHGHVDVIFPTHYKTIVETLIHVNQTAIPSGAA